MTSHSRVVGGSTAARVLNCPGSAALIARLPEIVEQPSYYATEGSACHTVLAELIAGEATLEEQLGRIVEPGEGHSGEPPIEITAELMHDCIVPAFDYYRGLKEAIGPAAAGMVEETCAFPGIEGAYGTIDLVVHDVARKRTFVVDWKFGAGVAVYATYPDPDDPAYESVNPQLLFYACAARHTFPSLFPKGGEIVLTIVQPRMRDSRDRITTTTVTHAELDAFAQDLKTAVSGQGNGEAQRLKIGPWCRFSPCRIICPLHLGPVIDLTRLRPAVKEPGFREVLLDVLDIAEQAEVVINEARRQAQALIESGTELPGWKLVPKRGQRKWIVDAPTLVEAMKDYKIRRNQLYETKLLSPAKVEDLLPKDAKLPEGFVATVSSGTTLARDDDARGAIPSLGAVAKLLAALKRSA